MEETPLMAMNGGKTGAGVGSSVPSAIQQQSPGQKSEVPETKAFTAILSQ